MKQKQQSDNPIPPPIAVFKRLEKEKFPLEVEKSEQEEIAQLAGDPRWKYLKKIIDQYIIFLKNMIDPLSGGSMITGEESVEEVGFKYLIVSSIVKYLEEIKNLPDLLSERTK
jgi:hypothetical protein